MSVLRRLQRLLMNVEIVDVRHVRDGYVLVDAILTLS
jgi:hypothetical protein